MPDNARVEVTQISDMNSGAGVRAAYFNIHNPYGGIGVSTYNYNCVTFVSMQGNTLQFTTFKDVECADEWLDKMELTDPNFRLLQVFNGFKDQP